MTTSQCFHCYQFSSVAQSCQTICTPWIAACQASCLSPNPRASQTHDHRVSHAIQPSHLLLSPSPTFNLSQHQGFFSRSQFFASGGQSISFNISPSNEYSGLISFRMDWLDLFAVQGTQESSPTSQFKSINSLALSLPYGQSLTSIPDYWKNCSFD